MLFYSTFPHRAEEDCREVIKEYDGCCLGANQAQSDANKKDLANFWFSLIKERDVELVEKIKEMKIPQDPQDCVCILGERLCESCMDEIKNEVIDDVLLLLTTTPTEGGE